MKRYLFSLLAAGMVSHAGYAEVKLPAYFSDNMIVQQNSGLVVSGHSSRPGSTVTVTPGWNKKQYTAKVNGAGEFSLTVPTPKAGGPFTLTVSDGDDLTLNNVVSGEVWLCSGQSNMEMQVKGWGKVMNWEQELAAADHPSIRLLQVKRVVSTTPRDASELEVTGDGWAECSPASVENFSAVAYFYARALADRLKVPVGVIDTSWGGTPAEAWTSVPTLQQVVDIDRHATEIAACGGDMEKLKAKHERDMNQWMRDMNACDPGMDGDRAVWAEVPQQGWATMDLPGAMEYKGLPDYDGTVWFQRIVEIPEAWEGKELTLNVGKVDDEDVTYFNGVEVGRGGGYWIPRSYKVPASLVKAGKALVAVKVQDESGTGGICGDASELSIGMGDDRVSLAGQWGYHIGVPRAEQPRKPETPASQNYPGNLYNSMIHPLKNFPVRGAIWYQGESNVDRWEQYTPLFQAMINNWRDDWGKDMPFYFVQLANFLERHDVQPGSTWAHLREAQANALQLDNTGMAVAIDIGEAYDIHPKNKQEVGARLARAALAGTYGKGTYAAPRFESMTVKGDKAVITMDRPVTVKGDKPTGFVVCGADMQFHRADVTVEKNVITVSAPGVKHPVAVRYGWADNPACNLYGSDGLPVAPFRTDCYR